MIKFLFKGLMRDRSRSVFPILTVFSGVFLSVCLYSYLNGVISELVKSTAHFNTGHVRIMTRAYKKEVNQNPNDLALLGVDSLLTTLKKDYPEMIWTWRIKFGGLCDIPDARGETKTQGPASGMAVDLLRETSHEKSILNIQNALVRGSVPDEPGEILMGDDFAEKLAVEPDDTATLISSTMYGSMTMQNFRISGTIRFGIAAMDKGAIIADISDIRQMLDMNSAAGEILGFFPDDVYHDEQAAEIAAAFNQRFSNPQDQFSPDMGTFPEESGLTEYLQLTDYAAFIIVGVFIFAMSIVLWNAGLMSSLRRYGEIGVRLAIGETRSHIYRALILESVMIGIIGSLLGTIAGLGVAYWMQQYGIDISDMLKNSSMMISNKLRARVTTGSYFIGFLPGLAATVLGTSIAGIGVYRRETAQLFKELEV